MTKKNVIVENNELEFEPELVNETTTIENEVLIPEIGSKEWTEFILSELDPTELINKKPKCSGIRRMVEKYIGPIIESRIVNCFPPVNGVATIVYGVKILLTNPKYPGFAVGQITAEDIADSSVSNTPAPYNKFLSAVAATRAESRALRKVLKINVISAEEGDDLEKLGETESFEPQDKISEEQINFLDMICSRCDISTLDFINSGKDNFKSINDITHSQAASMLQYLNDIQRTEKPRPKNVGKYNKEWRNNQ